jgi:hypothetical protein
MVMEAVTLVAGETENRGLVPDGLQIQCLHFGVGIGSGSQPATCVLGTADSVSSGDVDRSVTLTTHFHIIPNIEGSVE